MRYILSLLLFALTCLHAIGQNKPCNLTVNGRILDLDSGEPLPFATITIRGTTQGAVADENGNFTIENICQEEIDLEVRFVGYKTIIHHHDFHHSSPMIFMAADETLLESVVVEEELNAHELKTIDAKKIEIFDLESLGTTAGEVLATASGVSTLKTGQNIVKPIIHGLHSNRVLVINNGVRHVNQAWGDEHGIEIDVSQIDQIRLIKGAATVRYGPDALGGVILFESPSSNYSKKLNGDINAGFESNGRGFSGEFTLQEGYEKAAWRASVSGSKFGDLRAPNYLLTNTGKEELGFTTSGKFHFPWMDIEVLVSHFNQELGILRGSVSGNLVDLSRAIESPKPLIINPFSYEINTPRQEVVHDLAKLSSSLFIGEQQFDIQYAIQRNIRKEFDVRRGTNNEIPAIDLELISQSLDIDWDHPSQGAWAGTFGIQLSTQDNDNIPGTNTIPFVPNFNTLNIGLFGIESYNTGNTTYEAGIRFDYQNFDVRGRDRFNDIYRDNITYENLTFSLGLIKDFSKQFSLRTNIGSAWRAPNINELYAFGKHANVFEYGLWRYQYFPENDSLTTRQVLTNDDKEVKSERGLKWITTLNFQKNDLSIEITPHVNWIRNFFYLRPFGVTTTVRGTFPYFIYDQTDAIYSGIDIDAIKKWSSTFNSEIKVSYIYARDTKNEQNFVGIPPLNVQFAIEKKVGHFNIKLSTEYEATQHLAPEVIPISDFFRDNTLSRERTESFDFMEAPQAFFLLGASIGYQKNNLQALIKGENLLNTSYRRYTDNLRYYTDDIGANVGIFIAYTF